MWRPSRQDPSGILDDGRASSASNEDVDMANKDEGGGDGEHHGKEKRRKLMVEELREETMSSCSSSETDKVDDLNLKQWLRRSFQQSIRHRTQLWCLDKHFLRTFDTPEAFVAGSYYQWKLWGFLLLTLFPLISITKKFLNFPPKQHYAKPLGSYLHLPPQYNSQLRIEPAILAAIFDLCMLLFWFFKKRGGIRMQAENEDYELKQVKDMAAARKRWEALVRDEKVKLLTPKEAGYAIQLSNKTLLDVRPSTERQRAWVKGSTWIPIFEVDNTADPGTVSRKVTSFVMGGWWSGVPTLSYDTQFLSKVMEKFPKDTDLIVACQKGLRPSTTWQELQELLLSFDSKIERLHNLNESSKHAAAPTANMANRYENSSRGRERTTRRQDVPGVVPNQSALSSPSNSQREVGSATPGTSENGYRTYRWSAKPNWEGTLRLLEPVGLEKTTELAEIVEANPKVVRAFGSGPSKGVYGVYAGIEISLSAARALSLAACELLYNAGYTNLFWVQGGLEAAEDEDLVIEGPQPLKFAGIGGMSEFLGWTDQQRVVAAKAGWGYRLLFSARLVGVFLIADALFIGAQRLGIYIQDIRSH
ncbi:hypothetical protein G4B88_013389 [Cannabis sativa]|uniref:Rhodanese domain-containing protein n=1 Tax=Cannabis sativa TaxID=3483 RepID=A0A7J6FIT9_CANSA|nr:hypothetical protein G4B88_013389 [Cannabis sativa]